LYFKGPLRFLDENKQGKIKVTIQVMVSGIKHQSKLIKLENGGQIKITAGDTVKLLNRADIKTLKKGSDLIVKDANGNEYILKDFYKEGAPSETGQKLSWDDELGSKKELLSTQQSAHIAVASIDEGFGMFILSLAGMGGTYGAIANNHKNNTPAVANKIIGPLADVDTSVNTITDQAPNDTAVGIVVKAADPDTIDTITYSLINNAGGRFKINPDTGIITVANGAALDHITAQSHIIRVRATSSDGSYSEQDFTINVTAAQTVAVDDAVTAIEGQPFTSAVSLLANDTDVDGPSKSAVSGTFVTAQGGSLVLAADGSYTYTPATGFSGTDTVSYTVTDGALTDSGLLTITVNPSLVLIPIVAVDDTVTANAGIPFSSSVSLLANDIEGSPDKVAVAGTYSTAQGGTFVLASNGHYTYTPPTGFSGTDTVSYTVTDSLLSDSGLLTITVNPLPTAIVTIDAIGIDSGTYRDFITSDNDGLWVSFTLNESLKLDETVYGNRWLAHR
jgi:hypothetical protein